MNRDQDEKALLREAAQEACRLFDLMVLNLTQQFWSEGSVVRHCANHVSPEMARMRFPGPASNLYGKLVEADRAMELNMANYHAMLDAEIQEWLDSANKEQQFPEPPSVTIQYAAKVGRHFKQLETLGFLYDARQGILSDEDPEEVVKRMLGAITSAQQGHNYLQTSTGLAASMLSDVLDIREGKKKLGYRVQFPGIRNIMPI